MYLKRGAVEGDSAEKFLTGRRPAAPLASQAPPAGPTEKQIATIVLLLTVVSRGKSNVVLALFFGCVKNVLQHIVENAAHRHSSDADFVGIDRVFSWVD
jgi:hypothetical protein